MPAEPLVGFLRGRVVESVHHGSIAVVDERGRLVAQAGDPERPTTLRSSAKPFQAMHVVTSGTAERFRFSDAELALTAGSHSGEPRHTQTVQAMLERAGLTADALECGVHPPFHAPTRRALEERGEPASSLHHNCSGKHCGMLCSCVLANWDRRTYYHPDHPLQQGILRTMSAVTGIDSKEIEIAVDGCGVPTFAVPLRAFALSFARLATASNLDQDHVEAATRVRQAMVANPEMVAGEERLDTVLMSTAVGRVVSKSGAEACHGVALPELGLGIALKIEDGGTRAVSVALLEVLHQLDVLTSTEVEELHAFARPAVYNYRNELVGEGRSMFTLRRV
jgi:L-asparaginase II